VAAAIRVAPASALALGSARRLRIDEIAVARRIKVQSRAAEAIKCRTYVRIMADS